MSKTLPTTPSSVACRAPRTPTWTPRFARRLARSSKWRRGSGDRGRALVQIADALDADIESVARILALETGNAIRPQARPEIRGAADVFRYFGGLASELKGETIPLGEHVLSYTRREPIGVVGAIVPWNAPVVLGALKIAMAVAAGNTLVLKAAEDAPLALLRVAQICGRASASRRPQSDHRLRRGVRRRARPSPHGPQAVLHRIDRSRQEHHACSRGPHRAGVTGAWRQEPRPGLPGRR